MLTTSRRIYILEIQHINVPLFSTVSGYFDS